MRTTPLISRFARMARRQVLGAALAMLASALLGPSLLATEPGKPLRVVVLSDFNESYGSTRYTRHVDEAVARAIALKPDLVISTGDMVAGQRLNPSLTRAQIEPMWRAFHDKVSDPLTRAGVPFVAVAGNHDASSGERFRLEREIYREQWSGRRPALDFVDTTHFPFRYAFRLGGALFIALDATFVGHLSREERDWLAALLDVRGPRARTAWCSATCLYGPSPWAARRSTSATRNSRPSSSGAMSICSSRAITMPITPGPRTVCGTYLRPASERGRAR